MDITVKQDDPFLWLQHDTVNEAASGHLDFSENSTALGSAGSGGWRLQHNGAANTLILQACADTTIRDVMTVARAPSATGKVTIPNAEITDLLVSGTLTTGDLTLASAQPTLWLQHDTLNEAASGEIIWTESASPFGTTGYGFKMYLDGARNDLIIQSGSTSTVTERLSLDRDTGKFTLFAAAIGGNTASANYIDITSTGNMTFAGSAGFYPRRVSQSAEPASGTGSTQIDTGEMIIWHDSDDNSMYLMYNDTTAGIKKVTLT